MCREAGKVLFGGVTVKNAMSLKAIMKNMAKEKKVSAQLLLQNYMLERLLERVSVSKYKECFILKGGFLIASMVGLDTRATMDMDCTIKGLPVTQEQVQQMFEEIAAIDLEDSVSFSFTGIGEIREDDEYAGYRVALYANFPPMRVPLKLDVTTGDIITPKEMEFSYKLMLEDRRIEVLAYNLETILAEKLETVISRGDQNTRPRDYYDIYILTRVFDHNIDLDVLKVAILATATKRGSDKQLASYEKVMDIVAESEEMNRFWRNYQAGFDYAKEIAFADTCQAVVSVMKRLV